MCPQIQFVLSGRYQHAGAPQGVYKQTDMIIL